MPFLLVFLYVIAEVLAFVGMSSWLGFGWALLLMIALMGGGSVLAAAQLRRPRGTPMEQAATTGILMVAMLLSAIPGYLTSMLAWLLIIPLSRQLLMNLIAKKIKVQMEDFGARLYQRSPMAQQQDFYGSFITPQGARPDGATPDSSVIDEDEIRQWTRDVSPEDFNNGESK
ncbi:FxsA family protein [Corynebacterium guangdongense]|uniref:UPF0716 protein FxsA n=1 Tax=Corynebacterium guangdongense TaxID=1783348 RepID=A0ABU1ZWM7_9CORY|nr:FxsA family protein [Corynebacterium guangdongense]MDR7329326.1 UPF0716 protein FxsA [Corynebacterium guangdongense]WJZ17891.1 phage T7 F exclusion suppressor FxsA [Corynebacterium guangdongense]